MPKKGKRSSSQKRIVTVSQPKTIVVQTQPKKRKNRRPSRSGSFTSFGTSLVQQGLRSLRNSASSTISRIFGQGDYLTNSTVSNSLMNGAPSFSSLTSGFRVRHREYLFDLQSSVSYTYKTLNINPGLSTMFPWLSQIANNFETYKIHGLVIYLNSTSAMAVASTNTALGLWGVVTQYDPVEPDFTTKQAAEMYVGCQTAPPSQSLLHGVECKPSAQVLPQLYVRSGSVGGEDLKFYDWGKTQLFTTGSQAAATIGEVWVSYDIEFFKPRLPTGGVIGYTDRYYLLGGTPSYPFGTSATSPYTGSTLGTTYLGGTGSTANTFSVPGSMPLGTYLFIWDLELVVQPTTFSPVFPDLVATGSCVLGPNLFSGNSTNFMGLQPTGTSSTLVYWRRSVKVWTFQKTTTDPGLLYCANGTLPSNGNTFPSNVLITRISVPSSTSTYSQNLKLTTTEVEQMREMMRLLTSSEDGKQLVSQLRQSLNVAPDVRVNNMDELD